MVYISLTEQVRRKKQEKYGQEGARDLRAFVKGAWTVTDPSVDLVWGKHIDAICEHLMAVLFGQIKRLVICMPPRHMKPLWENDTVLRGDGARVALKDMSIGDTVISHTGKRQRVLSKIDAGMQPCVRLTTYAGRSTVAALDHPFLTPEGWVLAGDLQLGMTLGAVLEPETQATDTHSIEEYKLAGYLVGDGSVSYKANGKSIANCGFTTASIESAQDLIDCAEKLGFTYTRRHNPTNGLAETIRLTGGARKWVLANGIAGSSYTKRVPEWVFCGSKDKIAAFIAAYYMCDGTLSAKGKARDDLVIEITSVSHKLLADVQHLLLRLGIASYIRPVNRTVNNAPYVAYRLVMTKQEETAKFRARIPVFGDKRRRLEAWGPVYRKEFEKKLEPDMLASVEQVGNLPCICLEVEHDHTYTVDDMVCHNSSLISVSFQPWAWINYPQLRFLTTSYSTMLATRDSQKSRQIIESDWYQNHYGDRYQLLSDMNKKDMFKNTQGGVRMATSVGGRTTGEGGDIIIGDDLHNRQEVQSDKMRTEVIDYWRGTIQTRLNDPETGALILIGQRVHEDDVLQYAIDSGLYEVLVLPAEYERERSYHTVAGQDWRTEEGEALWAEKYPPSVLETYKQAMQDEYYTQFQQSPLARGGNVLKATYFHRWTYSDEDKKVYKLYTDDGVEEITCDKCTYVISTDLAISKKDLADFTVFLLWAVTPKHQFILLDCINEHYDAPETKVELEKMLEIYKPSLWCVIVEDVAYQASTIQFLVQDGWPVESYTPVVDKIARAHTLNIYLKQGSVYFPFHDYPWKAGYERQLATFPLSKKKDMVDASTILLALLGKPVPRISDLEPKQDEKDILWEDDDDD